MRMTYQEYLELLRKNEDGSYVNLIIPATDTEKELDLRGKRPLNYTLDEVIRLKKYVSSLFDLVDQSTIV